MPARLKTKKKLKKSDTQCECKIDSSSIFRKYNVTFNCLRTWPCIRRTLLVVHMILYPLRGSIFFIFYLYNYKAKDKFKWKTYQTINVLHFLIESSKGLERKAKFYFQKFRRTIDSMLELGIYSLESYLVFRSYLIKLLLMVRI